MEVKSALKKLWWFIWEDNSIWSWIANFILAFVLIKFVVYPGLGFLLGTAYPVVAVVSGSMEHDGDFATWWQSDAYCLGKPCLQKDWHALYGITEEDFQQYPFKNGFNKGDIMVLYGIEPKNIKIGDVLVFSNQQNSDPIIHRVVAVTGDESSGWVVQTKGDHNTDSGEIDKGIREEQMIGKAIIRVPFLGWIKIAFVELLVLILPR
jgi:signal peptidase I